MRDAQTQEMFSPAVVLAETDRCPECKRKVGGPLLGPAQLALLPNAPMFHAACLAQRQEREGRAS